MTSFSELSTQVHKIKDMILTEMVYDTDDAEDTLKFSKHLHCTKFWFARTSAANKKKYLLCLLNDISSAWALAWILKSVWNCYTKDAVVSCCEPRALSGYDIMPIDHNRTALPVATLAQAMSNDRKWFHGLQPEAQASVLTELLTISGGPIMWSVYNRAHAIYDRYREKQLQSIIDSVEDASSHTTDSPKKSAQMMMKSDKSRSKDKAASKMKVKGREFAEAEAPHLQQWNAALKVIRERINLEEVDVTFKDGSAKKIWKINRIKPEIIEANDFIQLLPSAIAKMILAYLPRDQLQQCTQVNKYWAFLIEDFRAEQSARVKIDAILERLKSLMFRHDSAAASPYGQTDSDLGHQPNVQLPSVATTEASKPLPSQRPSVKSGRSGKSVFSASRPITAQALKPPGTKLYQPVCCMADLNERLERRGAADENIFQWCENIAGQARRARRRAAKAVEDYNAKNKYKVQIPTMVEEAKSATEGILPSAGMFFPCPLLKKHLNIPMEPPLYKDPTHGSAAPLKRNISNMASMSLFPQDAATRKHIGLWSRDFSSLYHAFKIPSHQFSF